MLILSIRTSDPDSEIGLFEDDTKLGYKVWPAHRELAETIHITIKDILSVVHKDYTDLQGIICFQGPGSFTGLRIGLSVGNALAYSLNIPIVGSQGKDWLISGRDMLKAGTNDGMILPFYGSPVYTTPPRK